MASPSPPEAPSIEDRIQALPQELQDVILDVTIGLYDPPRTVELDAHYKSPLGLQVNRATRASFVKHYYQGGFMFHSGIRNVVEDFHNLWFSSLPAANRDMLQTVSAQNICELKHDCQLTASTELDIARFTRYKLQWFGFWKSFIRA